ncbi:MAG: translation initiation factor IF-3 [Alphaproteobacteria bacterium RIFCSPLOWO2_01_FULL_40_26]|nr:MAG: translation initiation factor IF-3 [Alphaproteobacteria bacterium RIFCSPHIGHO2_02_FULL_40_34]OFW87711.1 MAG: translation initiation factor IF-3 [Alphaproteobacteria bacterium RIFCSPHIGHO2_01_FULL_40_8]OFW95507.1 MAG: translation initiation factor IF-3 [Alphaproteobacteria bacterium RIFCSPLOWO2_01_FULL_40_26]OFX09313.1 MAG: translation initiation factor IF-3 [Alphaproteobacteria bacterium RIFCSPLOWO2_02_FULL_40_19]OFX10865.1 MAG: translation initiation factor IF-3 [Alphaproteobacteria ba
MRPIKPQPQANNFFRINEQIRAKEIRLIDHEGNMVGIVQVTEGIRMAREVGLDLIEVSPNANPPVCKISNSGKMKYELQKKAADAKKKQKVVELKEIKMTINIGKGDYDTKIRHTKEFIADGNKVKISIRMRGREITHRDLAEKMMNDILHDVEQFAKPEINPKLEGMQMVVVLAKK